MTLIENRPVEGVLVFEEESGLVRICHPIHSSGALYDGTRGQVKKKLKKRLIYFSGE